MDRDEVQRYGRQMILPEWGKEGQLAIRSCSVLIVGCGGLGCPAAQYLAAAGIGCLGLVDYDTVEVGNLHRQVLHSEGGVGQRKSHSVVESLTRLNSRVKYVPHHVLLDSSNALDIIREYSIVVDCTDNVATRYLLNDACVLLEKPLVSGSALRFEGQLTVYNYRGGPCYRCLFPAPPPPHTVTNCSEGGVLGVVPGVIGNLQALEVLKMAANIGDCLSQKLLLFDGLACSFRTIRLRSKRPDCVVCGDNPTVTALIDYPLFCGSDPHDKDIGVDLLDPKERLSCEVYKSMLDSSTPHLLVDVRERVQYNICSLPHSINIPISSLGGPSLEGKGSLDGRSSEVERSLEAGVTQLGGGAPVCSHDNDGNLKVVAICRRGNDSQFAVKKIQKWLEERRKRGILFQGDNETAVIVKDVVGGLESWSKNIDPSFPVY